MEYVTSTVQGFTIAFLLTHTSVYAVSWLYGIVSASIVYTALSLAFPDKTGSLVAVAVHPDDYLAKKAARSSGVHGSSTPDSVSEKGGKEGSARSEVLPVV